MRREFYKSYLKSSQWQLKRKEAIARANWKCESCLRSNCVLEVHHKDYTTFGHEKPDDLEVLCGVCHENKHLMLRRERAARRKEKSVFAFMSTQYGHDWFMTYSVGEAYSAYENRHIKQIANALGNIAVRSHKIGNLMKQDISAIRELTKDKQMMLALQFIKA